MFHRILVVCTGNICRSPTGEALLRRYFSEKHVSSAGVAALVGYPADELAINVAAQQGVDLSAHRARQLNARLCAAHDLILVMEKHHLHAVHNIAPAARGKVMLFAHHLKMQEIPDPYRRGMEMFADVYQRLDDAARAWSRLFHS